MKAIKIYDAFCMGMIFSLISCNSFLDEPEPQQALPSENAITTVKDIQNHVIGAYSAFKLAGFFGCNVALCSDLLADNCDYQGAFQFYREIYNHSMSVNNVEINAMWRDGYRAINQANLVMEALETTDDPALSPKLDSQYMGEALFIRAVGHFELVRYFGLPFGENSSIDMGVPIMTKGTAFAEDITFPSRNSVKEVYNSAIADLTLAAYLLPDFTDKGRANKFAALGYLAEIHFQMRDYAAAADYAQQVIDGPYSLTALPETFFVYEDSPEEIWCVKETAQDNPGRNASLAALYNINVLGGAVVVSGDLDTNGFKKIIPDFQMMTIVEDSFEVIDLRFDTLTSSNIPPTINVEKYEDYVLFSDDAPVLRLAKFKLMRAEALARTNGNNQESIDLLNEIRVRSLRVVKPGGTPAENGDDYVRYAMSDFADTVSLIEAIILERRVELCFEGNRFHDLCRLQRDVNQLDYMHPKLRFPIPQREINVNSNLEQNP